MKAGLLIDKGTAGEILQDSSHFNQSPTSIYASENQSKSKETNY